MNNDNLYNNSILLIGPSGAGKSEVGKKLHEITGIKQVSIDDEVYKDRKKGITDLFENNFERYKLWKMKELLKEARAINQPRVVDFGAGHSVYRNPDIFRQVKEELSNFKNIVLLIPSVDIEKSLEILRRRSKGDFRQNREFITSPCNRELATITIYENGRTPEEIANEILQIIKERENSRDDNGENIK